MTKLEEDDPADIMDMKWDGSTGMLEIYPKYEEKPGLSLFQKTQKRRRLFMLK